MQHQEILFPQILALQNDLPHFRLHFGHILASPADRTGAVAFHLGGLSSVLPSIWQNRLGAAIIQQHATMNYYEEDSSME